MLEWERDETCAYIRGMEKEATTRERCRLVRLSSQQQRRAMTDSKSKYISTAFTIDLFVPSPRCSTLLVERILLSSLQRYLLHSRANEREREETEKCMHVCVCVCQCRMMMMMRPIRSSLPAYSFVVVPAYTNESKSIASTTTTTRRATNSREIEQSIRNSSSIIV